MFNWNAENLLENEELGRTKWNPKGQEKNWSRII